LKLGLVDRNDPICELVARKVLDIAKRCVTEAAHIVSIVLKELGPQRPPQRNDSFGRANPVFSPRLQHPKRGQGGAHKTVSDCARARVRSLADV